MSTIPTGLIAPESDRYAEAFKVLTQIEEEVKKYGALKAPDESPIKTINSQLEKFKNGIASEFPKEVSTTLFTKMNRVYDKLDRITTKVELVATINQIQEFNEGKIAITLTQDQIKELLNTPNISPKHVVVLLRAQEKLAKTADTKSESNNNTDTLIHFTPPPSPKTAHTPTSPGQDLATIFVTTETPNPSVAINNGSPSPEYTPPTSPDLSHSTSSESSKSEEPKTTDTTVITTTVTLSTVVSGSGGDLSPKHTPPVSPKTPHLTSSVSQETTTNVESKKEEEGTQTGADTTLKSSQESEKTPEIDSLSHSSGSGIIDASDLNLSSLTENKNTSTPPQPETKSSEFDVKVSHIEGVPSEAKTEITSSQESNNNTIQIEIEPPALNFETAFAKINDTINGQKKDFHSTITIIGNEFAKFGLPNLGHFVFGQAYFFAKKLGWDVSFKDPGEEYVKTNLFTADQLSTITERAKGLLYLECARHYLNSSINSPFANPQLPSQIIDSICDMMDDCEKYSLSTANAIYGATWKYATETEKKNVLDFGKHAFKGTKDVEGKVLYPISTDTKLKAVNAVITDCKIAWNNN